MNAPLTLLVGLSYRPSLQTQHLALFGAMTALALVLAVWIARTRRTRGARLFALTLGLFALRAGVDVVHGLVGELWTVQAVLVGLNPLLELCTLLAFLGFAARYATVDVLGDARARRAMAAVAVVAGAVVATNPLHSLVFAEFHRLERPFVHVVGTLGPLGLGLVALEAVLLLAGATLLAHAFTAGRRPAWWPATLLAVGVGQAALITGLQFAVGELLPGYDTSTLALGGFLFLATVALRDHGLRRIEVVARQAIIDEIDDAVVFLDPDGATVDANPAAERLFPSLDGGTPFGDRFDEPILPATRGPLRTEITLESVPRAAREQAVEVDDRRNGEGATTPADTRHYLVHTTPVTAATEELLGYAVRFVDVTRFERRSSELARTNERLDRFASTVSHDLRNPLNVASGYLELAVEAVEADPVDVPRAREYLGKVDASLDRMNAIIGDILALAEDAGATPDTRPVAFERIATAAWDSVETGQATLEVTGGGTVEADPRRLQRLLENLFRNAIDHVGGDVAIEAGLEDGAFFVADDGPGIPEGDRERIFDHGFTTGETGTGLGLAIVQQLAEAHGWTVELDPDHDGARFVVRGCETSTGTAATPAEE